MRLGIAASGEESGQKYHVVDDFRLLGSAEATTFSKAVLPKLSLVGLVFADRRAVSDNIRILRWHVAEGIEDVLTEQLCSSLS